jgi:alkylation response protein AidB-like acyl-CoA dehydrogenase
VVPVEFSLTDSQQETARLAGRLLAEGKADPWKELARSGLLALSLPAELGGDGRGVLDTAVPPRRLRTMHLRWRVVVLRTVRGLGRGARAEGRRNRSGFRFSCGFRS